MKKETAPISLGSFSTPGLRRPQIRLVPWPPHHSPHQHPRGPWPLPCEWFRQRDEDSSALSHPSLGPSVQWPCTPGVQVAQIEAGDEAVRQPGVGVQEDGAGGRQPQQQQQQLQLKAHVQEEGAGEEPQHAAVHGVLWGQAAWSGGGPVPWAGAGDTPGLLSYRGEGRGDSHADTHRVGLVSVPVQRMEWGKGPRKALEKDAQGREGHSLGR